MLADSLLPTDLLLQIGVGGIFVMLVLRLVFDFLVKYKPNRESNGVPTVIKQDNSGIVSLDGMDSMRDTLHKISHNDDVLGKSIDRLIQQGEASGQTLQNIHFRTQQLHEWHEESRTQMRELIHAIETMNTEMRSNIKEFRNVVQEIGDLVRTLRQQMNVNIMRKVND